MNSNTFPVMLMKSFMSVPIKRTKAKWHRRRNMKQGTKEWLEMRKSYLGASDAPAIMKVSPWRTPLQLWEEKVGLGAPQEDTYATQYGQRMEEPARIAYEKDTGNLITPKVIFHPEHKFMMASLDGLTFDGDIIVEIKNANKEDHQLAKDGKIPEKYWPQLQHQLACKPNAVLHYWSFHNGEGELVKVERDENYIKELVEREEEFWQRIKNFEAPEPTPKDRIEYTDDEEWSNLFLQAEEIDKREKANKLEAKEIKMAKDAIKDKMLAKTNGRSAIGSGIKFTVFPVKGPVDYKALEREEGIDINKYRGAPSKNNRYTLYNDEKEIC